jgi:putative nucleotidyltransferase with HDIG domain
MASKLRSPGGAHDSSLFASMHKDKAKFQTPVEHVEGPPIEIDEEAAQEKIQSLIGSSDPLSDYIFSLKNVDPRLLGRIDGWLHEIEPKDKYLEGHARQVAQYALAIGQQLGLDEKSLEDLHLAALLHDVGKLGIPQEILQKPDEDLNDDELIIIMKHSIDGANLLSTQAELSHLAPFVHSHHEEFNGNGYPHGLNGEGIPLASRIINVANAYHNMVAPLCFRSPMDPTKAQEELTKGAGTVYDPRVVEALILAIMQQKIPAVVA